MQVPLITSLTIIDDWMPCRADPQVGGQADKSLGNRSHQTTFFKKGLKCALITPQGRSEKLRSHVFVLFPGTYLSQISLRFLQSLVFSLSSLKLNICSKSNCISQRYGGLQDYLIRDHPSSVSGKSTTGTIRPPQHNHYEKRGIRALRQVLGGQGLNTLQLCRLLSLDFLFVFTKVSWQENIPALGPWEVQSMSGQFMNIFLNLPRDPIILSEYDEGA